MKKSEKFLGKHQKHKVFLIEASPLIVNFRYLVFFCSECEEKIYKYIYNNNSKKEEKKK